MKSQHLVRFATLLFSLVAVGIAGAAQLEFSKVFQGTGKIDYSLQTNRIYIEEAMAGSDFRFGSAEFTDPDFSGTGNNVEGIMSYTNPEGMEATVIGITGILSRRATDGSTPIAYYFVTPDGTAFLMVIPGHENDEEFLGEGYVKTNSAGIRDSLNELLEQQVAAHGGTAHNPAPCRDKSPSGEQTEIALVQATASRRTGSALV